MSFEVGQRGKLNGIEWLVGQGRKAPGDLTLVIRSPNFRLVPMALVGLCTEFFCENEDRLYPPPALGGRRFLNYLEGSVVLGWELAASALADERRRKVERDAETESLREAAARALRERP